jgi:hypothetical protein
MDNIKHTKIVDVYTEKIGVQAVVEHGFWLFYERQGRNRPSPMRREAQIKWVRTRLLEDEIITHHLDCTDVRTVPSETQFSFQVTR